ncbi:hypothetical protein [Pedobacter mendelii]|nr:hypothetical protein [Pedobacter mendelii]
MVQKSVFTQSIEVQTDEKYKFLATYQSDTSRYMLENFVTTQAFYKQKAVSTLLNKLEAPIKYFSYGPDTDDQKHTTHLTIAAYNYTQIEKKVNRKIEPALLVIYLTKPIPLAHVDQLMRKNKSSWTKDEVNLFGNQIIDHIDYLHYKFK